MNDEETEERYKDNVDFESLIIDIDKGLMLDTIHISILSDLLVFNKINFNDTLRFRNNLLSKTDVGLGSKTNYIILDFSHFNIVDNPSSPMHVRNIEEDGDNKDTYTINYILFDSCTFDKKLYFNKVFDYNIQFLSCKLSAIEFETMTKTKDIEFVKSIINEIQIKNSKFDGKFYINDQKFTEEQISINNLIITESTFHENFKLHNCKIAEVNLDGVDFKKNADFFKSIFVNGYSYRKEAEKKDVIFNGINVDGLTIFEECIFYNKFILKYVTFNGLAQFRKAEFCKGFDLDRTNSEKEMNFNGITGLDKDESVNVTSQETYRTIKYNCERIGNIVDGNKYHALELEKRKEHLSNYINYRTNKLFGYDSHEKCKGSIQEWIVFQFNWYSSNFGTNWILPLIWIYIVGWITNFNLTAVEDDLLYCAIKYMSIAHIEDFKGHPIAFLFNKITLGYLYYQFVTAVRKDTRK